MPRIPQRYRVLQLAHERREAGDAFTRRDAAWIVGCFELSARIGELEAEGVTFTRRTISERNHYGDPVRFTAYALDHAPPAALRAANLPLPHPIRPEAQRTTPF